MEEYIKKNWKPLLIGITTTMAVYQIAKLIEGIILKIAMILAGY